MGKAVIGQDIRQKLMHHSNSTASIHFANDSAYDVVKIEGGSSYKDTMRRLSINDESDQDEDNSAAPSSKDRPNKPPRIVLPTRLQDKINYVSSLWPGRLPAPTPEAESLLWMLKALKAATEAYLEQSIQYVEITNPALLGSSATYMASIGSASSALGLEMGRPQFLAAEAAARTHNVRGRCDEWYDFPEGFNEDDTQYRLFVAVGYNRATFSVFLMDEVCDTIFDLRTYHNSSLGSDSTLPREERHAMLKNALEDITRRPYQSKFNHERIQDVVLFGEATEDRVLRSVLEDIFGSGLDKLDVGGRQNAIDPLFAASRGAARDSQLWDIGASNDPQGCPI
ncbi:hypothetical protein KCU98_g8183, partial [Aureobasidium melanogenum]